MSTNDAHIIYERSINPWLNPLTRCNEACVVDRLHLVDVELVHDVVQEGVQVVQELDGLRRYRGIRL